VAVAVAGSRTAARHSHAQWKWGQKVRAAGRWCPKGTEGG